jgi:hypothetical protein
LVSTSPANLTASSKLVKEEDDPDDVDDEEKQEGLENSVFKKKIFFEFFQYF